MYRNDDEVCSWANTRGISIYQRSKTVWIASGSYRGQHYEVKGRTPGLALALWKEAARYSGPGLWAG
jgi:hypothetical protein